MDEFREALLDGWTQVMAVETVLHESRTAHQHLVIFHNPVFGRVLALDGIVQTTEADEFIYHEMLAHVPILAHGAACDVLAIGGGDGGLVREVLKHRTLDSVTMVEIDRSVIDLCRRHLPNHSRGAFDDPRLAVEIADGLAYVQQTDRRFDVIISDSTDPIGPGEALHSAAFYAGCRRCLSPGGVFVAQNGTAFDQQDGIRATARRLGPLFADTTFYLTHVPSYIGGPMALAWASDDRSLRHHTHDALTARMAAARIETRYYTPAVHQGAFALPAFVERVIREATTDA